jgi:hypothetical protein
VTLADQANAFAADLSSVLRPALGAEVTAVEFGDFYRAGTGTFHPDAQTWDHVPLRAVGDGSPTHLTLRCWWSLGLDATGRLTVKQSWMHLEVRIDGKGYRPIIRIEVDPNMPSGNISHIHFHAESTVLGWLAGLQDRKLREASAFHFPLGGRHFRPTVEDILFFLDDEGIFDGWHGDWKPAARENLERFRIDQTIATIERHRAELEGAGWTVTPPP